MPADDEQIEIGQERPDDSTEPEQIDADQQPARLPRTLVSEWRLRVTLSTGKVLVLDADDEADAEAVAARMVFNRPAERLSIAIERRLVSPWRRCRA
jgi:hypothetical protein